MKAFPQCFVLLKSMRKCLFVLLGLMLLGLNIAMHPFYISVTELKFQPKQKMIQGSTKLFLDDVMKDIKLEGMGSFNPELNTKEQSAVLYAYFKKHLKIRSATTAQQLKQTSYFSINPIGWEVEEDAIWIHFTAAAKSFHCVEVFNNLLFATCNQQVHIYQVNYGAKKINDRVMAPTALWQGCFE